MDNEFLVVKGKRKSKKPKRQNFCDSEFVVNYVVADKSILVGKIEDSKSILEKSDFIIKIVNILKGIFKKFDYILCYGLGSITDSYIARHQLAALITLSKNFNCRAYAYDPVFNPIEIEALEHFGISVYKENDEGKRKLSPTAITIVYFPHCSSQLVNNFLWANWNSSLHNCVILSNSFSKVIQRNDEATVKSLSCLNDIIEITNECTIDDTYEVSDVFNDLSIHSFPVGKVLNPVFWTLRSEPNYSGQIIEFCPKDTVIRLQKL